MGGQKNQPQIADGCGRCTEGVGGLAVKCGRPQEKLYLLKFEDLKSLTYKLVQ